MRFYAEKEGADVERWGLTGLLHDFDWEIHPTLEEHPLKGAPILREKGIDEEIVRAILSHGYETGVPRESRLEKALYACDEVTGLITAVALVRPSKSLSTSSRIIKKEMERSAFVPGETRRNPGLAQKTIVEYGVTGQRYRGMRKIAPETRSGRHFAAAD